MAKDEEWIDDSGSSEKSSGGKKNIIIIMIMGILAAVLAFFLVVFVLKPMAGDSPKQEKNAKEETKDEEKNEVGEILMIDDLIINPADTKGKKIIAISLGLEVSKEFKADDLKKRIPLITDSIISLLSRKDFQEFYNIGNRSMLRKQIFAAVLNVTPKDMVKEIYFSKYIMY